MEHTSPTKTPHERCNCVECQDARTPRRTPPAKPRRRGISDKAFSNLIILGIISYLFFGGYAFAARGAMTEDELAHSFLGTPFVGVITSPVVFLVALSLPWLLMLVIKPIALLSYGVLEGVRRF